MVYIQVFFIGNSRGIGESNTERIGKEESQWIDVICAWLYFLCVCLIGWAYKLDVSTLGLLIKLHRFNERGPQDLDGRIQVGWWRRQLDAWVLACTYINNWFWLHQDSLFNKLQDPTYINNERIREIQGSKKHKDKEDKIKSYLDQVAAVLFFLICGAVI